MKKVFEVNSLKWHLYNLKWKAKDTARKTWTWIVDNKEMIVILLPVAIGGVKLVTVVVKGIAKNANLKQAEAVKNLYCYDTSLGKYWELKRKLSNQEWLLVEQRRAAGEKLGTILSSINVLK